MTEVDAVVALSGEYSRGGGLGESTIARMDTALHLMNLGAAARLIVTGNRSFFDRTHRHPLAELMEAYAQEHGLTQDILVEARARETVGNAVFTKEITEANGWTRLMVVTNEFHLPRSEAIFRHVMGPDYAITGVSVPNCSFPRQTLHEKAAKRLTSFILSGTKPGDTEAIKSRLFSIIPGYVEDAPIWQRIGTALSALSAK